ncbi:MAG: FAD-dependent oxidoreductase [Sphingorhabdus sp.]
MKEFDIVVIGAGSAGSAVAGRLAEDGKYSVCLLEAGGRNNGIRVKTPGLFPFLSTKSNYKYDTVPQAGLNGRIGYQPRGRGLGGSSAINAMLYIRGHRWDYDNWAAMGCAGWSYNDVLPYFRRSEGNERLGGEFHGSDGPLNVMDQRWVNPASLAFVEAARNLQIPIREDFNGAHQEGMGVYQVTQKAGERWSAARAFVEPLRRRDNFSILTGALVEKLVINEGKVTGVKIKRGWRSQTIKARGSVILCGGAFGSPQILQLSGIGPAQHLRENGIEVALDRAEIGENLQDHIDFVGGWKTESREPIGDSFEGNLRMAKAIVEHRIKRTGIMTTPYAEVGGFWRTSQILPAPDVQFHFVPGPLENHGRDKAAGHGISIHACVLRPESRGTLRLNSSNAADAPRIDPNFLSDDRDIAVLRQGVREMHRFAETAPLSDLGLTDRYQTSLDDDDALDHLIREKADTVYHPVGTCRMGADKEAVVDPTLKFNGLDGLFIADASVMPKIVSGNTNAPTIMIGERCAEFVRQGLQ